MAAPASPPKLSSIGAVNQRCLQCTSWQTSQNVSSKYCKSKNMANTPFYRVLGVWSVVLLFLIFLVIRLDRETDWFWFIIFIPFLIFDCFVIFFIFVRICLHIKDGVDPNRFSIARKFWFLFMVASKLSFIIVLCCRLENIITASYYVVFIPLWIFLLGLGCDASAWVWVLANARG